MKWALPPLIKIYEALGTIADERIEVTENSAKVYSSSKEKYYTINYDPEKNAIMSNDNGSYWTGKLGYPSIAYLMKIGIIRFDQKYSQALKGIAWKDINQKFKNDFDRTILYVRDIASRNGISLDEFDLEIQRIDNQIKKLDLNMLGKKVLPPKGY